MASPSSSELIAAIPLDARRILEIGCGDGNLARTFRARQPNVRYIGIEADPAAAACAASGVNDLIAGAIDDDTTLAALDRLRGGEPFDAIILTDGLAGLRDPGRVLVELKRRIAPGGACIVRFHNRSHWSVLRRQVKQGRIAAGPGGSASLDSPLLSGEAAMDMISRAGWALLDARPRIRWPEQTAAAVEELLPLAGALGVPPLRLRDNIRPYEWIFRAINGPVPPQLHIGGMGLARLAGVTEARIDYPLAALNSLTRVRAIWGDGSVSIPQSFAPGVLIVQRQWLDDPGLAPKLDNLIGKGWVVVFEIDDDPRRWPEFVASDFYSLRAAHAVTVSTERLADFVRPWNPNVAVFPNAIHALPAVAPSAPKRGDRIRIVFAALHRWQDWSVIRDSVVASSLTMTDRIEYVVVHDNRVFDSLPEDLTKEFHPTLPPDRYMELLASCDIALLPLEDSGFNRCKSDLKFIECCAAGAVPICSPTVYSERAEHLAVGVFPPAPDQWGTALSGLCNDRDEIARRRALGLAYVKQSRMHAHQVAAREAFYRGLSNNRAALEAERQSRLARPRD